MAEFYDVEETLIGFSPTPKNVFPLVCITKKLVFQEFIAFI